MNEKQAFDAIRNAIRLENLGRDVAAKVTPDIIRILKEVATEIKQFPGPDEELPVTCIIGSCCFGWGACFGQ